jgi:class 3 adenylate cyclase
VVEGHVTEQVQKFWDRIVWGLARGSVEAVRYRPNHLALVMACGCFQPDAPSDVARWVIKIRARPEIRRASGIPHAIVRMVSSWASRWLGPTASAVFRWSSGAVAAVADELSASTVEHAFRARAHPGLLVPHPHAVAVLAVDMRGFSNLTVALNDTQYLTDLVGDYLTELTAVVERHRGVVFQYTGDGLLGLFLPELSGSTGTQLVQRLVSETCPELHDAFDVLRDGWRADWVERGVRRVAVGLGVGLSYGEATIGFMGPSGKKQFGVIGAPVNLAAFLCSEAEPGTVLVDRDTFARAGTVPPGAKVLRLRSKKLRRRIETVRLEHGVPPMMPWFGSSQS